MDVRAPSPTERRAFLILVLIYAALAAVILPWAQAPGVRLPQIIAVSNGGIALADLCTALVLGHEFRRSGRPAVLVLLCAYLFSAVMAALQAVVFPGAVFDTPLFGGMQTSSWLFLFWRSTTAALYLATVLYARKPPIAVSGKARDRELLVALLLTCGACALLGVIAAFLEVPATAGTRFTSINLSVIVLFMLICGSALMLIWRSSAFGDALFLWLALVLIASIFDQVLATFGGGQYTLGWHLGKASSVVSACLLLVLWLGHLAAAEATTRVNTVASYGGALAVMVSALLLRWFVTPWLGNGLPVATVFGAVAIAVWIGGWRPATLAAVLGLLATKFLFAEAVDALPPIGALLGTGMYVGSCALIIGLGEAMRRARDRSRAAEQQFRQWQEASLQGFAVLSAVRDGEGAIVDFRFAYINPRGAAMFGRTLDAVAGQCMLEVLPGAKASGAVHSFVGVVETGEPSDTEVYYEGGGIDAWFRNLVVRVDDGICVSFSDITQTKRLEADLRQRAVELQRADANKSQFLAILAHELRNPMAPLVNGLALLGMLREPKALADTQAMMSRQIDHLRRLIDDLLDVSRIDHGKLELVRERVAMDAVVRNAIETAKPNLEAKSHELVVHYAPDPLHVEGDPVRLSQIVANLLNNAAKFTPPRGRIDIALSASGSHAVVAVTDTGVGFEPGDEQRMFDMFVQLESGTTAAAGGLGLGLTLVHWLTKMHGGTTEAHSAGRGKGAKFVVRLPLAQAVPELAPTLLPRSNAPPSRRVLIVDDNADACDSLAQILELEGFEVRTCHDGARALDLSEEFRPEVIFLDLNMPGVTGYEVAAKLRATPWGRAIRIVALTGMGQKGDLDATRAAGFDAHLTKPASIQEVMRLATAEPDNVLVSPATDIRRVDGGEAATPA